MNQLKLRIEMYKILNQFNDDYFSKGPYIPRDVIQKMSKDPLKLRALNALEDCGCIVAVHTTEGLCNVCRGRNSNIYLLNRTELWINRIVSFIAGVVTAFVAEALIRALL